MLSATRVEMSPAFCAIQPERFAVRLAMFFPCSRRFCAVQHTHQPTHSKDLPYVLAALARSCNPSSAMKNLCRQSIACGLTAFSKVTLISGGTVIGFAGFICSFHLTLCSAIF
jgi:hypothetical protein